MRTLLIVLALVIATSAQAEGVAFRWVTDEGTVSFTDTEIRIPAKYRDRAVQIELRLLEGLEVLTRVVSKPE